MKISFITTDSINEVWQNKLSLVKNSDLLLFGFNGLNLVSYKKELSGETEYFHDIAKLSKQLSRVIICGCDTDNYGVYRHSAVIADSGKLLGVSDMVHVIGDTEFAPGGSFRVYDTTKGKIGVLILDDLFFPEASRVLALCDADIIVCVYKNLTDTMPITLIKANAFSNGVAHALCADNYYALVDKCGKIITCGTNSLTTSYINLEKDYSLISSRRRGFYKDFHSGY